jgi:hypothetical protein
MDGNALARLWKDPDAQRDWPDDEHPSGQMYLHLSAFVGGFANDPDSPIEPDPPDESFPWIRLSYH